MRQRYEFREDSSNKFWEIELKGKTVTTWWGKIGTEGQSKEKVFADEAAALKEYNKLVAEKTGKGYVSMQDGQTASTANTRVPMEVGRMSQLMRDFAEFVGNIEHGGLGYFDFKFDARPTWGDSTIDKRLARDAFAFITLGEGSQIISIDAGPGRPRAICLLGSEGDAETLSDSFEEFLLNWSQGDSGVGDLDEANEEALETFSKWLRKRKVQAAKAGARFDISAYLSGGRGWAEACLTQAELPSSGASKGLIDEIIGIVGMRADSTEVQAFGTKYGVKIPPSLTDIKRADEQKPKSLQGITVWFSHNVIHEDYPPIPKTKSAFIPYVARIEIGSKFKEALPFGLRWKMKIDELNTLLSKQPNWEPDKNLVTGGINGWARSINPRHSTEVYVDVSGGELDLVEFCIRQDTELTNSRIDVPSKLVQATFIAWAFENSQLSDAVVTKFADVVAQAKERNISPATLLRTTMPRGLWFGHFKHREFARQVNNYFHRLGEFEDQWIRDDFCSIFGSREGQYGHDEPILDDDTWSAVDRVRDILNRRFSKFIGAKAIR
jgi:predicted DNA-binding WGR domain protein